MNHGVVNGARDHEVWVGMQLGRLGVTVHQPYEAVNRAGLGKGRRNDTLPTT
jgi:hypothetical protein